MTEASDAVESWRTRLCALWSTYLAVDVGVDDDFWALGGDSLIATRIVADVTESAPGLMRLRDFFESSTVAELAAVLAARGVQANPV